MFYSPNPHLVLLIVRMKVSGSLLGILEVVINFSGKMPKTISIHMFQKYKM